MFEDTSHFPHNGSNWGSSVWKWLWWLLLMAFDWCQNIRDFSERMGQISFQASSLIKDPFCFKEKWPEINGSFSILSNLSTDFDANVKWYGFFASYDLCEILVGWSLPKRLRKIWKFDFEITFRANCFGFGIILNDFISSTIWVSSVSKFSNPGIQPTHDCKSDKNISLTLEC